MALRPAGLLSLIVKIASLSGPAPRGVIVLPLPTRGVPFSRVTLRAVAGLMKAHPAAMRLNQVKEGQTVRIVKVAGNGQLRRRILEMGLTRGAELHVEKYAPLRDPMELIVKGFHISLRVAEANEITVEPIE